MTLQKFARMRKRLRHQPQQQHCKLSVCSGGAGIQPATVAVIVATYRRAGDLRRCLESVGPQMGPGDQLIVVTRPEDEESRLVTCCANVTHVLVLTPGVIHAENAGLAACHTELVAFIDDDGAAPPDWVSRIRDHFRASTDLGAVCGPVVPVIEGRPVRQPAKIWGRIQWYGRHIGNTDRIPERLTECDIVRGCNMAFRRGLIQCFDPRLLGYWRFEDDAALTVKDQNYRVLCDPNLAVLHYMAPVRVEFSRTVSPRDAYCLNHNNTYVFGKHFSLPRFAAFVLYTFWFGDRQSLGVARLLWRILRRHDRESLAFARSSLAGKCAGLRSLWA
jgi:glycosyltransferase involved in cell wall biosynthesis